MIVIYVNRIYTARTLTHSHIYILYIYILYLYSLNSEVNLETGLRFRPPNGFTDSREFSEAECDRERALDLEVQQVMEKNNETPKIERDELTSLLAR